MLGTLRDNAHLGDIKMSEAFLLALGGPTEKLQSHFMSNANGRKHSERNEEADLPKKTEVRPTTELAV